MSTNFEFINIKRIDPDTKPLEVRKANFGEIYEPQTNDDIAAQSSRCLDCGNPYCEWKCPLHNFIPDWLKLANEGKYEEAADLCHQTNSFPEICGRICPQDKLCEGACTLNTGFEAVTIGQIEKHITDTAINMGWKPKRYVEKFGKKHVSIIGAGPAGLACAENLIRRGVKCTVYDKNPEIGGLLTYGIPEFKLEKSIVLKRREMLEELGVKFVLNTEVDTKKVAEIEKKSDAIFLGLGTYESIKGKIEGTDKTGVVEALPYLIKNTEYLMDPDDAEKIDFKDQRVAVLGGGDTAMDCVRTAVRQQAKSVTCIYRRDQENMPGSIREIKHAMEEGVDFLFNTQPLKVEGNGSITSLKVCETKLGEPDATGRQRPELIEGSEKAIEVDKLVIAFGYQADVPDFVLDKNVKISNTGLVELNNNKFNYQTSNPKYFAGGDMIIGSSLAVHAIAHGRDAAKEIIKFLG